MDGPQKVYETLDRLGIQFERYEHPPVFNGVDAAAHWGPIPAMQVKNLFLRNKKGNREYLVILPVQKRADLRDLVRVIGDDRLSFGSPDRLMASLGVLPGSVSPFGLIHEGSTAVRVIVDEDLRAADRLIFHPNVNTASVTIGSTDFARFLASRPNTVKYVHL